MWKTIQEFFSNAWKWIQAVWDKHDEMLEAMVRAMLPMVIDVAFRNDLSGEEKKKAIVDAVLDNAGVAADTVSTSVLNEAIEIAVNRYNIQIGKLTVDKIDAARLAALKAARDFANGKLKIVGDEAENAGFVPIEPPVPTNEDLEPN